MERKRHSERGNDRADKDKLFVRHRSVENARQYCISKIIGRLDTKREFSLMSKLSCSRKIAEE